MKLYFRYVLLHLKTLTYHCTSFIFLFISRMMLMFTTVFSVIFLVPKDVNLMGFSLNEILLSGLIISTSKTFAEVFARGFDIFGGLIKSGDYDKYITRPVSEMTQVFMSTFDFTRLGGVVVQIILLIFIVDKLPPFNIWYLGFLILTGTMLYICLYIIYGATCFYTTENLEVFNILTHGTAEFGKVPFAFYGEKVLKFLTFVLPLALAQYYPVLHLLKISDNVLYLYYPLFAYLFILPTIWYWKRARRHYGSVGS